jgi:hypothetical protein
MDGITAIKQGGKTRYIGIQGEADRLNVSRQMIYKVLKGQATSARIEREVRIREVK